MKLSFFLALSGISTPKRSPLGLLLTELIPSQLQVPFIEKST